MRIGPRVPLKNAPECVFGTQRERRDILFPEAESSLQILGEVAKGGYCDSRVFCLSLPSVSGVSTPPPTPPPPPPTPPPSSSSFPFGSCRRIHISFLRRPVRCCECFETFDGRPEQEDHVSPIRFRNLGGSTTTTDPSESLYRARKLEYSHPVSACPKFMRRTFFLLHTPKFVKHPGLTLHTWTRHRKQVSKRDLQDSRFRE